MTATPRPAAPAPCDAGVVVDLYVVCDGMPGPGRDAAFVEVEDADGYSHGDDVGIAWAEHPSADGMYRLGPFRARATARPLPAGGAVDAAGIDGASRVVMNLPTPPAPPTDDGGAAFAAAVGELIAMVGSPFGEDRARAHVVALHAAALARAEAAERALSTIALQVADYSDDLDDFYDRVSAVVAHLWPLPEAADAPPALVNGGPPTDALDDGR